MRSLGHKNSHNMIKAVSVTVFICLLTTSFFSFVETGFSEGTTDDPMVLVDVISSSSNEEIFIEYTIGDFHEDLISYNGQEYHRFSLTDESSLFEKGSPNLPSVYRSIVIPDDKQMSVEVVDVTFEEVNNIDIIPSKGEIPRTVDPEDVVYEFNEVYTSDAWFPEDFIELNDPYILRDFRALVVQLNPIQYNPIDHTIRIVSEITVKISSIGPGRINVIDREKPVELISEGFHHIYDRQFINFNSFLSNEKYSPVSDQGNMLVICYDDFYDEMVPFVEWKNMMGQPTEIVLFSEVGSTASDIDDYIESYYDTNGLTFVLLVGDSAQIPTLSASGGESDVTFSYITDDHYSDLFIGRFSAETSDQVITQVERTVDYEKNPSSNQDWYHKGLGVASNQGSGDEGEYDDEHIDNIRDKLLAYTYTDVGQSYDPSGTSSYIEDTINDGLSIINYCGHGSTTSWSNGGGFNSYDVNDLVNDNMLPFIFSVACVVGNFGGQTCFCETWLRATNNGQPTGAIAHFGSSINQDWNEPMDGQDEINDILVESYSDNIKRTFGGLSFNGVMHMLDNYGSAGFDDAETWHIFGDPSVVVRTDTPTPLSVSHEESIPFDQTSFEVSVDGLKNALCALSCDGELLGSAYTDSSGEGLIVMNDCIPDGVEQLTLVVTAYNKMPYITNITVFIGDPDLSYNPTSLNAGPVSENETVQMSFEIWNGNVGSLEYSIEESCDWIVVSPLSGVSTGEHDTITVDVDTQGLSAGTHQCFIDLSSNGGNATVPVSVYVIGDNEQLDIDQSEFSRGFPIRHAADGDWAAAQSFTSTIDTLSRGEIYLRRFGDPEFDLVVELRKDSPDGPFLDRVTFSPQETPSSWDWFLLDFTDVSVDVGSDYFMVIQPAPSGVTTSFGYEWAYAFDDVYVDGSFWFTRDGGGLWRDLPDSYEFAFRTYGYI